MPNTIRNLTQQLIKNDINSLSEHAKSSIPLNWYEVDNLFFTNPDPIQPYK